jgi:hypothetical protein
LKELTVKELCEARIYEMKEKAYHNKSEALWSFKIIMLCSLSAPLFVAFGDELIQGKIIPSILSVIAAFGTAWIQLRKPQSLWGLYRTAQRDLEEELYSYNFNVSPYDNSSEKDKLLHMRTSELYVLTHKKWLGLVPSVDSLSNSLKKNNKK